MADRHYLGVVELCKNYPYGSYASEPKRNGPIKNRDPNVTKLNSLLQESKKKKTHFSSEQR